MRVLSLKNITVLVLLALGAASCASMNNALVMKDISVEVYGEVTKKPVTVYMQENDSRKKIMQFKGGLSEDAKHTYRVEAQVGADVVELTFIVGKLKYIFDVKVEQGLQCIFHKSDDAVSLLRLVDENVTGEDREVFNKTSIEALVRFHGYIPGNQVALHVNSALIFDENVGSDTSVSASRDVEFSVTSRFFNILMVADGFKYSVDLDSEKGCFVDFHFAEKQLIVTQYLNRESMPGLY